MRQQRVASVECTGYSHLTQHGENRSSFNFCRIPDTRQSIIELKPNRSRQKKRWSTAGRRSRLQHRRCSTASAADTILYFPGHKHTVWIFNIASERLALLKSEFGVKPASRFEGVHRSSFQTQSPIVTALRFVDEVLKEPGSNTLAQVCRSGPHRFNLRMLGIHFFKGAAPDQFLAVPHTPECNLRFT